MKKRKIKDIENTSSKYGLYFDDNMLDLELEYRMDYISNDINHTIKYYELDIVNTEKHKLYGESKPTSKKFKNPVEINILPSIEDNKQAFYGNIDNGIIREDSGNLTCMIFIKELENKNVTIKRGDIITYNLSGLKNRMYEIIFADNVSDVTSKTLGGFIPIFKKVIGSPVKEDYKIE